MVSDSLSLSVFDVRALAVCSRNHATATVSRPCRPPATVRLAVPPEQHVAAGFDPLGPRPGLVVADAANAGHEIIAVGVTVDM
jgi:hypothetical protein